MLDSIAQRLVHARDAGGIQERTPAAVIYPRSSEEVAAALRAANRCGVPITVRAGGLTCEGETLTEGLLLDIKGLQRVLHVDREARLARVQGGADFFRIFEAVRRCDLMLRAAPLNLTSTLGGTIAVGGIDVSSFRAGFTADHVRAAEIVLPTGEIVRCDESENRRLLDATLFGYGQYGITTELTIEVDPYAGVRPEVLFYSDPQKLVRDLLRVARERAADFVSAISVLGEIFVLALGFETEAAEQRFHREIRSDLGADQPATLFLKSALQHLRRPWSLGDVGLYLKLARIDTAIRKSGFMGEQALENRPIPIARANWRHAAQERLVLPDIIVSSRQAERMVESGIAAGRRAFEWFTVYLVPILSKDRTQHPLCPVPPPDGDLYLGMEVTGYRKDRALDVPSLLAFKNEIYSIAEQLGGRAYRFGGEMRPWLSRLFGEPAVQKAYALKEELDPRWILNPETVFLRR